MKKEEEEEEEEEEAEDLTVSFLSAISCINKLN